MMARRGEAVWQVPHNEPQYSQRPFRPSRRAPRGARTVECPCSAGCFPMAVTPSPPANSGALGERDLCRGSLRVRTDQPARSTICRGAGDKEDVTNMSMAKVASRRAAPSNRA